MSEVVIVTGPSCPNCTMLKKIIEHLKLPAPREVEAIQPEGIKILAQTGVRSIPVLARMDGEDVAEWLVGSHNPDAKVKSIYEL